MEKHTKVFIEKFQRFEKLLKQTARSSDEDHFPSVLKKIADQNIFINKNYSLALDLNSLRNVFAHRERGKYIANINNYALKKLEGLIESLKNPPTVISKFRVKVYQVKTSDFISSVIAEMREKTYTHVPVWNGKKFVGVFSYTSFFEWLAEKQNEGSSEITFGKKVMGDIDRRYLNSPSVNYRFIKQTTNLYEIPPIFEEETRKRKRLDCLFITKKGVRGGKDRRNYHIMGFGSDYMISSARKDRRAYELAKKYLLDFGSAGVTPEILEKYLNFSKIDSESKTMAEIYKRLLISAQNANMKAGVIGGSIGGIDKLGVVLFEFDPVAVFNHYEDKWDDLLNEIIMRVKPRGSIRRTTRSIWPKYCQSVLSGAKFLSQFKTTNEFYEWVGFFDKENRARHALPMLISHEIHGFGFALACDFLKELGYVNFGKPDGHIKTIFSGLGLCAKDSGDYEVFKAIIRVASNVGVDAYNVDKLFWLAGSGYFYADTNLGKNGRISQINEAKFIEYARKLLAA